MAKKEEAIFVDSSDESDDGEKTPKSLSIEETSLLGEKRSAETDPDGDATKKTQSKRGRKSLSWHINQEVQRNIANKNTKRLFDSPGFTLESSKSDKSSQSMLESRSHTISRVEQIAGASGVFPDSLSLLSSASMPSFEQFDVQDITQATNLNNVVNSMENKLSRLEKMLEKSFMERTQSSQDTLPKNVSNVSNSIDMQQEDNGEKQKLIKDLTVSLNKCKIYIGTLETRITTMEKDNKDLLKKSGDEKDTLHYEISSLKEKVQNFEKELSKCRTAMDQMAKDNSKIRETLDFFQQQPDTVHTLIDIEGGLWDDKPLQKGLLTSFILNSKRECNLYTTEERDFWIDQYLNVPHSKFENLCVNLNGPTRRSVELWSGKTDDFVYGMNCSNLVNLVKIYDSSRNSVQEEIFHTLQSSNLLRTSDLSWGSKENLRQICDVNPLNLMVDETATKIIVQYNAKDRRLYGFSMMPRFVLVRGIEKNFDIEKYFEGLKIQYDKKKRSKNFGVSYVDTGDEKTSYYFGHAQFETYEDWQKALDMNGKDGHTIEELHTFPVIPELQPKIAIDKYFSESFAIDRPRTTYVYSMAINSITEKLPVREACVLTTNNRFLQVQDHKLYTYNLLKLCNQLHLPIFQIAADGDTRFRNEMLHMGGFAINNHTNTGITLAYLEDMCDNLFDEAKQAGWLIPKISASDVYHFFIPSNELQRASIASTITSSPCEPFSPDTGTTVRYYLFLRGCIDVLPILAPVIGGLPRSPCQDQCHWLRKIVKIALFNCSKVLSLGDYIVLQSQIAAVYEQGPQHGLLKADIDVHNKSDQKSAERLISNQCLTAIKNVPWSLGTEALLKVGKLGFEAWWKVDLSIVQRIGHVYYVAKFVQLWRKWLEIKGLSLSTSFISNEVFKDTLIMCSSLPQLAIIYKLYLPDKAFCPWRCSEYPLESYFSAIRGMFGHADEFSVLEYLERCQKVQSQQNILIRGNVRRNRAKTKLRDWSHPSKPTKQTHPQLFEHEWSLPDLFVHLQEVDKEIVADLKKLGMVEDLKHEEMLKVTKASERFERYVPENENAEVRTASFSFLAELQQLQGHAEANDSENVSRDISSMLNATEHSPERRQSSSFNKSNTLSFEDQECTISRYVTVFKQRGDVKASGMKNVKRFTLASQEDCSGESSEESVIKRGMFVCTKTSVFEILQLRKDSRIYQSETTTDKDNVSFLGTKYKRISEREFSATSHDIKKSYTKVSSIVRVLTVSCRWTDGLTTHIKIKENIELGSEEEEGESGDESKVNCYCRDQEYGEMIKCSKKDCRIQWFHLECVGLTSETVPRGRKHWYCPRCADLDHWCFCGSPEGVGKMGLIGCSNEESCPVVWFHLSCVGLHRLPQGDWYCSECNLSSESIGNVRDQICHCKRGEHFDDIVVCCNQGCKISKYHLSCIETSEDYDFENWLCDSCA